MRSPASAVVVIAVAFTSLSSIIIRLSTAPALVIASWRMIIASVILLAIGGILRGVPRGAVRKRDVSGDDGRDIAPGSREAREGKTRRILLVIGSGVFLAAHFAGWISSLELTSVLHSTVLVTVHPVIVLFGTAIIYRRRPGTRRIVLTITALAGAILLSTGGSISGRPPTVAGDALAFLGAVAVAVYLMIGGWARRSLSAVKYNIAVHSVAAVVLVVATRTSGFPLFGYPIREYVLFGALAFFCTILGHSLMNWALAHVDASDVSVAILLEPIFASTIAAYLFEEIPGVRTLGGAAVVLISLGALAVLAGRPEYAKGVPKTR
ncbi:MAG: DMT family transporter [Alkalispirochaeta sp.]